jgi:hypothetical protein
MDFTDSSNPVEIAYFDRGPIAGDQMVLGGYWSTYYYHGRIYGTEIARGLDVLTLTPSQSLSQNEIAAAALADQGPTFNPQQQFPVKWPDHPVVALAYVDQLERSGSLAPATVAGLRSALNAANGRVAAHAKDPALASQLERLAEGVAPAGNADARANARAAALRKTLGGISAQLR